MFIRRFLKQLIVLAALAGWMPYDRASRLIARLGLRGA